MTLDWDTPVMVSRKPRRSPSRRGRALSGTVAGSTLMALAALSGCNGMDMEAVKASANDFANVFAVGPDTTPDKTEDTKAPAGQQEAVAPPTDPEPVDEAKLKSATQVPAPKSRAIAKNTTGSDLKPAIGHPYLPGEPSPNKNDPSRLVGMDESGVVKLLGQPQKVRSKPPGTIWSYSANGCSLDVFFYLDIASERFRVLAYEVSSTQESQETKKVCLGRIQSAFRTN